jgi:hypothetical protein
MEQTGFIEIIQTGLLLLFIAFVIIFIYFGITLVHHWNYYSFNIQIKRIMQGTYFFVSIIILLVLLTLIGLYFLQYGF